MSYKSEFTGEQMDAVFRRVTNMAMGSVVIEASIDGHGYGHITDITSNLTNPKIFASIRGEGNTIYGCTSLEVKYDPEKSLMFVQFFGDGIEGGKKYRVDYLMIE